MSGLAGPWYWTLPNDTPTVNPDQAALVIGPDVRFIDRVAGYTLEHARLIAAAPQLLRAAQEAVSAMGEQHGGAKFESECNECHAHRALVAAIAKATGAAS